MQGICTRTLSTMTALGAACFVSSALLAQTSDTANVDPALQDGAGEVTITDVNVDGVYREENGAILGACGTPITQNNDPDTITGGQVACGAAPDYTTENGWARSFPAGTFGTGICQVRFGIQQNENIPWTIDVNIYTGNINGPFSALNLIGTKTVTIAPVPEGEFGGFYVANFFPEVPVPAGSPVIIELFSPTRATGDVDPEEVGNTRTAVNNVAGETAPSYLRAESCGIIDFVTADSIGFPDSDTIIVAFDGQGVAPVGPCCLGEGEEDCEILTEEDCTGQGGNWLGENGFCSDCPITVVCPSGNNCPQDFNGDNVVNVVDLLALLSDWGSCPGCDTDLNGDDVVNVLDMLDVLGAWGACPAGGSSVFDEPEACGDSTNDGCNDPKLGSTPIGLGQTVCGTAWADKGTRDTDWYEIVITDDTQLTWQVHAEFAAQAFILTNDCENLLGLADGTSAPGVPFEISVCVPAGTYYLFVSDVEFEGNPCGSDSNDYVATAVGGACEYVGACCFGDGDCQDISPADCAAQGGEFNDFVVCSDEGVVCLPDPVDCPQGDIDEGEPCDQKVDDVINGGCNVEPETFGQLCCGDTVTGTVFADGGTRDLDWFLLTLDTPQSVTWTVEHGFGGASPALDGLIFITTAECPATTLATATGPTPVSATAELSPGQYFLIVTASDFEGLPCGSGAANEYTGTVDCLPFTLCEGLCGDVFFDPDTGFFCSCEPDCLAFGTCCPGVCDICDDQEQCELPCQYIYDDNNGFTGEIGIGDVNSVIMWLHKFTAEGGSDVISSINTTYGAAATAGAPVGYAVYSVAGNGGPGTLLFSSTGTINGGSIGTAVRQELSVPDVAVTGEFFVGVWVQGDFPAPLDETVTENFENVWAAFHVIENFGDADPADIANWDGPPDILTDLNPDLEGVWYMCAD